MSPQGRTVAAILQESIGSAPQVEPPQSPGDNIKHQTGHRVTPSHTKCDNRNWEVYEMHEYFPHQQAFLSGHEVP